ncbi:hypothetical protein A6J75_003115 [Francisella tularensis]|nr:hypothetical protein NE061598_02805 [Francisella tularensis subsp. tularensis NE061598]MWZ50619.1 hypothetical protein [Francisella tularensis]PNM27973.1 hypothetical protein A6J75_003115 [Francisella tularensis]ROZ67402.1 hypothetical protein EHF37_03205 [Francisella tularensis]ROZ70949.1 hypothetical protein EGT28_08380 [Francisella tularensis]
MKFILLPKNNSLIFIIKVYVINLVIAVGFLLYLKTFQTFRFAVTNKLITCILCFVYNKAIPLPIAVLNQLSVS